MSTAVSAYLFLFLKGSPIMASRKNSNVVDVGYELACMRIHTFNLLNFYKSNFIQLDNLYDLRAVDSDLSTQYSLKSR